MHLWTIARWLYFRVTIAIMQWMAKSTNCLSDIRFIDAADNIQLVTFRYHGRLYRGHLQSGSKLIPYFPTGRCSMKRPVQCTDADGRNVTDAMRQYWGPMGEWNGSIGLSFVADVDNTIRSPVHVKFNDLTLEVL